MDARAMNLGILLDPDEGVPLGMQLKNQLKYLINVRQLPGGTRLPPIRNLAADLNLSAGTVAQVYRELQIEGLLQGEQGRGTFVRAFLAGEDDDSQQRQELLDEALIAAVDRAYALGISSTTLRQHLLAILASRKRQLPVAVVFPQLHAAQEYARRLEEALAHAAVTPLPVELAALQEGNAQALQALTKAYYVITLAMHTPVVEQALELHRLRARVISITATVTADTLDRLQALPTAGNYALLTEERNIYTALNIIQNYSPIDYRSIRKITVENASDLAAASSEVDGLLFTLGARELIEQQGIPAERLVPLNFEISQDSLHRLTSLFSEAIPAAG
jgi:DNA-binding transcriptional regulator YhcF (GntR family)